MTTPIKNCRGISRWCRHGIVLCLFLLQFQTYASDLIEIVPITNKILMVYIKDGHIDAYGPGQGISNNVTYVNATNVTAATTLSNYLILSSDDGNYSSAKSPINLGRKSKATDYNDEWQTVPYVWGHWIYIELPTGMVQGKTYTIQVNNIVENKTSITFTYDVAKLRSETVHVNMIGFAQNSPKYAYLSQWMGDFNTSTHANGGLNLADKAGASFRLINYATGTTAYTGTIALRLDKTVQESANNTFAPEFNFTMADVWQCDFSSFTAPGEYVVAVDGIGCSYPFEIGNDATREPFYYAMKGLFWQRQGVVKEIEPGKVMPRDHHPDDIIWRWDKNWAGGESTDGFNTAAPRVYNIWGYYHDAGDWDGYVHHSKVPMMLLLLFDLAPNQFKDGEVGNRYKLSASDANWIDEGTNGVPDLLDEASWLINYLKRSRTVLKNNYGGTGGVPGYIGRDAIPDNNITAWQDQREWYLSAENIEQTFQYAGMAAWYAVCLNKYYQLTNSGNHPDYNSWMTEAVDAWNWANGKGSTIDTDKRAQGFAAACLYRATGNASYQTAFENYTNWEPSKSDGEWSNPNIYDLAISIYSFIPSSQSGLNTTLQNTCKSTIQSKANDLKVTNINANGFRNAIEKYQFFDLGGLNTPRLTLLPVAYSISGDSKYLDAIKNSISYSLGGNQLNMTYLSKLGERSDVWIFNPNGWLVNDYNSKVYDSEPMPGMTSYFGATSYWFTQSAYSEYFARSGAYPQAKDSPNTWPEGESKFYDRYSIQGAEFTIHQQNNYMIYALGYAKAMAGASTSPYTPNARPTVSLNLTDNQAFPKSGCDLTVAASADTRSVKYYYEWHYIGESTDKGNNFKFYWVPPVSAGTTVLITAVGYDDRGLITIPTDAGDKPVTISTSATCSVTTPSCGGTGSILMERFDGTTGVDISNLTSSSKYPNSPDVTTTLTSFEIPSNVRDYYGARLRGYICPPSTGSYTFWIAGDDNVQLWLSTSENAANKSLIASHTGWTNAREWNKYASQKSVSITLQAGTKYYVEALLQENDGGDNLAVGWAKPGESTASPSEVIPGSSLIPFVVTVPSGPGTGSIQLQRYEGISGVAIANLTSAAKFPASPDYTSLPTSFEAPTDALDNYGIRMRGYILPPSTGSYTFWIAGDDNVQLWLSTDDTEVSKSMIASHTGWTSSREWNKYASQKSVAITLQAGTKYYVEALMKENDGGDNLAVGWSKPGQSTIAPSEVVPGSSLIPFTSSSSNTTGLVHRWRFNNNGNDDNGTNNATLENGAAYTTSSKEGNVSLNLGVASGAKANVGTLNLTSVFTVTMWAYNTGDQNHQNWLLANNDGSSEGFRFFVNTYGTTDGKISFENRGTSNTDYSVSPNTAFPFNQWNSVALVVNNTAYTIYVNGTSVHSGTVQSGVSFNKNLYIGSMGNSNSWNTWKGYIDDVKIYNRALSASEVQAENNNPGVRSVTSSQLEGTSPEIMVYPVPLKDQDLNLVIHNLVDEDIVEISLLDVSGTQIHQQSSDVVSSTVNASIALEKFRHAGVYIVHVKGRQFDKRKKIIVNH